MAMYTNVWYLKFVYYFTDYLINAKKRVLSLIRLNSDPEDNEISRSSAELKVETNIFGFLE